MSWWTPNTYREVGVRWGTATSSSTRSGTTSVSTVRRTLDRNGVTRRHDRSRGEGRRTAAHVVEQLVAIYQADDRISVAEASSRVGVGLSAGSWILKQHGIVARTSAQVQRGRPGSDGAAQLRNLLAANGLTAQQIRAWASATDRDCAALALRYGTWSRPTSLLLPERHEHDAR